MSLPYVSEKKINKKKNSFFRIALFSSARILDMHLVYKTILSTNIKNISLFFFMLYNDYDFSISRKLKKKYIEIFCCCKSLHFTSDTSIECVNTFEYRIRPYVKNAVKFTTVKKF